MRKFMTGLILMMAVSVTLAACGGGGSSPPSQSEKDSGSVSTILGALRHRYPLPRLTDSSDLKNQIEYARVQSDPNKIEYLEFLSLSGQPIGSFTIRGQVSAESTRITSPVKDTCAYSGDSGVACLQDPQPDLTGTYFSQSGGGYFAYLTDGALLQWPASQPFITSDQPFHTNAPVQLSIDETKAITATHAHLAANAAASAPKK